MGASTKGEGTSLDFYSSWDRNIGRSVKEVQEATRKLHALAEEKPDDLQERVVSVELSARLALKELRFVPGWNYRQAREAVRQYADAYERALTAHER